MKQTLIVFMLLIPLFLCSQTEKESDYNTISGFISYDKKSLSDVTIFVEGTMRYTISDAKGFYSIKAKASETISYTYVGFEKVVVLVEEITSILNVNMEIKNSLKGLKVSRVLKLGGSTIGDYSAPYIIWHIQGDSLNKNATSLTKAIQEKVPDFTIKINEFAEEILYLKGRELDGPALWVFDEVLFDIPLPVYISEVKDIFVINSEASGFLIKVNTSINYKEIKDVNFNDYYFTNVDFYANDAIKYNKLKLEKPIFLEEYPKRAKSKEALELYLNQYANYKNNTNYHFEIFNYFKEKKYDKDILVKVLSDFENFSANNPEDLKGIAYKYQEINEDKKAVAVYKNIIKLRPTYSQSYRDLANAYARLKEYREAWLAYNYYLNKDFKIVDNDIDEIMTSEIIAAYNLDNDDQSVRKIKINNPKKNIESDVRVVFEWNTSEAEFILEFVNPNLLTFTAENSSNYNNDLIIDQKKKGYSSKEIFIEDLQKGDWLINLTYLGNKHFKPTIFKITTYYNWGRTDQTEEINVFDFTIPNKKMQLLKLNSNSL